MSERLEKPRGRPPKFPPGHPMASDYIRNKYGREELNAPPGAFDPIRITGYISSTAIRFNTLNEMLFEVIVPYEHIDAALPLREAVGKTLVPLEITVALSAEYLARLESDEEQVQEMAG